MTPKWTRRLETAAWVMLIVGFHNVSLALLPTELSQFWINGVVEITVSAILGVIIITLKSLK